MAGKPSVARSNNSAARFELVHLFLRMLFVAGTALEWATFSASSGSIAAQIIVRTAMTIVTAVYMFLPLNRPAFKAHIMAINTAMFCVTFLCLHAITAIYVLESEGFVFNSTSHTISLSIVYVCLIAWLWLKPWRVALLSVVAFLPGIIEPLIAATVTSDTWEFAASHADSLRYWTAYVNDLALWGYLIGACVLSNYSHAREAAQERDIRRRLISQAAKAQAVLETAVPRPVARALMSGVPTSQLTQTFSSATVAFIFLTDYDNFVRTLPPHQLLRRLDVIWDSLDVLLDTYGESLVKIETVGGCYIVAALPGIYADAISSDSLTCAVAKFCIETLERCSAGVDGGPVHIKIGINSGPLTAGIVGNVRQYFRLFGDTINVASRMMSTSELNKVHVSQAVADIISAVHSFDHAIFVRPRGLTFVKGKGMMQTAYVTAKHQDSTGLLVQTLASDDVSSAAQIQPPHGLAAGSISIPASVGPAIEVGTETATSSTLYRAQPVPVLPVAQTAAAVDRQLSLAESYVERVLSGANDSAVEVADPSGPSEPSEMAFSGPLSHQRQRDQRDLQQRFQRLRLHIDSVRFQSHPGLPQPAAQSNQAEGSVTSDAANAKSCSSCKGDASPESRSSEDNVDIDKPTETATASVKSDHLPASPSGGTLEDTGVVRARPPASVPRLSVRGLEGDLPLAWSPSPVTAAAAASLFRRGQFLDDVTVEGALQAPTVMLDSARCVTARALPDKLPARASELRNPRGSPLSSSRTGAAASSLTTPTQVTAGKLVLTTCCCCNPRRSTEPERSIWDALRLGFLALIKSIRMPLSDLSMEQRARAMLDNHSAAASAAQLWLVASLSFVIAATNAIYLAMSPGSTAASLMSTLLPFLLAAFVGLCAVFVGRLFSVHARVQAAKAALSSSHAPPFRRRNAYLVVGGASGSFGGLAVAPLPPALLVIVRVALFVIMLTTLADAIASTHGYNSSLLGMLQGVDLHMWPDAANAIEHAYVLPMVAAFLPLHLRFRLSHALLVVLPLAAAAVAFPLAFAPPPVAYTGWGSCYVVCACILTAITCYLRESGDRALFTAHEAAVAAERDTNYLLHNLLPPQVVAPILEGGEVVSQVHSRCAILHLDLAGFTRMSASMAPTDLMTVLNTLFSRFDDMVERRRLWKAETVGDAYIVVGGLFEADAASGGTTAAPAAVAVPAAAGAAAASPRQPAAAAAAAPARSEAVRRARVSAVLDLGLAMQRALAAFRSETGLDIHMRVGVHVGDVTTGIVGSLRPRFGVFGVAMQVAEHLESMAETDTILCSAAAHAAAVAGGTGGGCERFIFRPRTWDAAASDAPQYDAVLAAEAAELAVAPTREVAPLPLELCALDAVVGISDGEVWIEPRAAAATTYAFVVLQGETPLPSARLSAR